MSLPTDDQQTITGLKSLGTLEKIDPSKMDDAILIACGDCDRAIEAINWHRRLIKESHNRVPRVQLICINGGPLNLVHPWTDDPQKFEATQEFLHYQIVGSRKLKNLDRIDLLAHWPCGQAGIWNLSLQRALDLTLDTIVLLREKFKDMTISAYLHVDNGEKNTYHFSPRTWSYISNQLSPVA